METSHTVSNHLITLHTPERRSRDLIRRTAAIPVPILMYVMKLHSCLRTADSIQPLHLSTIKKNYYLEMPSNFSPIAFTPISLHPSSSHFRFHLHPTGRPPDCLVDRRSPPSQASSLFTKPEPPAKPTNQAW